MKKIGSKLLWMFVLVLSIFIIEGNSVQAEKEKIYKYGDFEYKYIKDTDYVAIVGYNGRDEFLTYPKEIDGKQVYSICCRDYVFDEFWMVREVVIEHSINSFRLLYQHCIILLGVCQPPISFFFRILP